MIASPVPNMFALHFKRLSIALVVTLMTLFSGHALAQLSITVSGTSEHRIPIAIADFTGDSANARALVEVIRSDLEKSGYFQLTDPGFAPIAENESIDFTTWKTKGADFVVVGTLAAGTDGKLEARFRLYDINLHEQLVGMAYGTAASMMRVTGHRIADTIYEKIRGERGIFSTRIAYVIKNAGRYQLQIADWDGQNAQTALISKEPIISPAWSPDGGRIAYVSFENKKPVIYAHSLATGRRQVIANFKGSNSAPAWSPNGDRLAIVLTKDGNSQIYSISASGAGLTRLTTSNGIDTEPTYSPDGQFIYFTSDRGGGPQIYRMSASGGAAERVTFNGNYNVTPRISPDGKMLAYIARNEGRFQLMLMALGSGSAPESMTNTSRDESPSFSPNSRMIVYATQLDGRDVLALVSRDGKVKQRLSVSAGDVREPTWGHYTQ